MKNRIKIIATVGPSSFEKGILLKWIDLE